MKKLQTFLSFRTRFAKDIVAEVTFPRKQTGKVAIIAIGAPSSSSRSDMMQFLAEHGYVAIFPRYRGTWESDGWFLEKSPAQDIRDVVTELEQKEYVIDTLTKEKVSIKAKEVHLFGGSFGGPAVLLNTDLALVKKVISRAPVLDWSKDGADEPFDLFIRYSQEGYGGMYRTKKKTDWNKLIKTDFYNPIAHTNSIVGKKVFILHAKDDTSVPYESVKPFAEKTGATYYLKPTGGHKLPITQKFLWKKIEKFLKAK